MTDLTKPDTLEALSIERLLKAAAIAAAGNFQNAIEIGKRINVTVSEALILGLLKQGVRNYISVFGHGFIDIAEVLRVYQNAGLIRVYNVRSKSDCYWRRKL